MENPITGESHDSFGYFDIMPLKSISIGGVKLSKLLFYNQIH